MKTIILIIKRVQVKRIKYFVSKAVVNEMMRLA